MQVPEAFNIASSSAQAAEMPDLQPGNTAQLETGRLWDDPQDHLLQLFLLRINILFPKIDDCAGRELHVNVWGEAVRPGVLLLFFVVCIF